MWYWKIKNKSLDFEGCRSQSSESTFPCRLTLPLCSFFVVDPPSTQAGNLAVDHWVLAPYWVSYPNSWFYLFHLSFSLQPPFMPKLSLFWITKASYLDDLVQQPLSLLPLSDQLLLHIHIIHYPSTNAPYTKASSSPALFRICLWLCTTLRTSLNLLIWFMRPSLIWSQVTFPGTFLTLETYFSQY